MSSIFLRKKKQLLPAPDSPRLLRRWRPGSEADMIWFRCRLILALYLIYVWIYIDLYCVCIYIYWIYMDLSHRSIHWSIDWVLFFTARGDPCCVPSNHKISWCSGSSSHTFMDVPMFLPAVSPRFSHLVGGIPTPLKNMKVSWEGFSHILWKIKFMFETTNQPYVFPCFWQFNQILHVSQFRIRLVIAIHSQVVHGYSYGFFGAPFPTQLLVVVIDSDFHGFDMFNPLGHWIDLRENLEEGKICFPPYPLLSVNIHEYSPWNI